MDAARASMLEILAFVEAELARGADAIELDVLDPDPLRGLYAGEIVDEATLTPAAPASASISPNTEPMLARTHLGSMPVVPSSPLIHRPWRTWLELAERLGLRMCTPRPSTAPRLRLRFEPLDRSRLVRGGDAGSEKYGTSTDFARIHKLEDPGFVVDVREALERVIAARSRDLPARAAHGVPARDIPARGVPAGDFLARDIPARGVHAGDIPGHAGDIPSGDAPHARVLYLGCNTGDEIVLVRATCPALTGASHIGVDHSASAIAAARVRFGSEPNISFYEADLATVGPALGRFDLIVSIGTLQSPDIDDRQLLRTLVQDHLAPYGAIIIGVPNCRYVDGEIEYGTRMKNFRQPELGLLLKDVAFYRKYLQQHHKQVFVTGKHYLLVTAVHVARE